ncbi:hypothetical protein, partial [Porphyromonas endodontalis]|uniref:hypothetical protein n=1 Tax=Porphyromonas endodontalis TaxID=28124 RepID=UPI0028E4605B
PQGGFCLSKRCTYNWKIQFADTAYKSLPNRVLNACDILRRVALHNKGYESEYHISSSIVAKKLDL